MLPKLNFEAEGSTETYASAARVSSRPVEAGG
jgi:hypothetical protein